MTDTLTEVAEAVLLATPRGITSEEVAHVAGVSHITARRWLPRLARMGLLASTGKGPRRRYFRP